MTTDVTIAQLGGAPLVPKIPGTKVGKVSANSSMARSIEDELSEDESPAAPRGRYGLRSKAQPAPAPVAGTSQAAPTTVKNTKKEGRSQSRPGMKTKQPKVEFIVLDDSDDEGSLPVGKGKGRAIQSNPREKQPYKSVEVIGPESGDESEEPLIDSDAESDNAHLVSTSNLPPLLTKTYCATIPEYWKGTITLPPGFLGYLGLVPALGRAQQSVSIDTAISAQTVLTISAQIIPCIYCIKHDLPCWLLLDHLSGCIACKRASAKRPCSLIPRISEKAYLKVPYSIFWMRHYFTYLVAAWMDGDGLLLPTRSVAEFDWSPGISKEARTSPIPKEKRKLDQDAEIERWEQYAETDWHLQWYGIPYPRAKLMWEDMANPEKAASLQDCYWYPEPSPNEFAVYSIQRFYQQLKIVQRNDSWTGYDMLNVPVMMPSLRQQAPHGFVTMRKPTPATGGMSLEDWIAYCADPHHHLVPADSVKFNPDVESEDGITGDFVEDSVWLVPQEASSSPGRNVSDDSAERSGGDVSNPSEGQVGSEDVVMMDQDDATSKLRRGRGRVLEMPPQELGSRIFTFLMCST